MFDPGYIKEAKAILEAGKRGERYRKDVANSADLEELRTCRGQLGGAIRTRSRKEIALAQQALLAVLVRVQPPRDFPGIRENAEFFLVILVVILIGLRTYAFGNFEIPTASMQPTMNGIIAHPIDEDPPNLLGQIRDFCVLGRTYVNVVCQTEGDSIVSVRSARVKFIWNGSIISMASGLNYEVGIDPRVLGNELGVGPGLSFKKGEPIVRAYADAGDHLIADKVSWNFVPPRRGQIIIFKTNGIRGIGRGPNGEDVFYIKRLAGVPGDELRIAQPKLFVNGRQPEAVGFQKVASAQDGYGGYWNEVSSRHLQNPNSTFKVPDRSYFALGDNSKNSLDSRYWGVVPARNVEGRAAFIYWPFTHFGIVQ